MPLLYKDESDQSITPFGPFFISERPGEARSTLSARFSVWAFYARGDRPTVVRDALSAYRLFVGTELPAREPHPGRYECPR
jgi:hypothetical protein